MQHLSSLYKDRPMTPQETLIYWTEYVIRHKGATHLQSETVDMPFYQYFLLDILLFLLIILLILIWISYLILKIIFQYCLKTLKHPRKADSKKLNWTDFNILTNRVFYYFWNTNDLQVKTVFTYPNHIHSTENVKW